MPGEHQSPVTLEELKAIKRQCICNAAQKRKYVHGGVMERLCSVLRTELSRLDDERALGGDETAPSACIVSTAVQTVGSLCNIEEGVRALEECDGIPVLLRVLERAPAEHQQRESNSGAGPPTTSTATKTSSATNASRQACWALKLLARRDAKRLGDEFATNELAFRALVGQLHDEAPSVVLNALHIMGSCVRDSKQFARLAEAAYDQAMFMSLLASSNREIVQQSILAFQNVLECRKSTGFKVKESYQSGLLVRLLRSKMRQPADEALQLAAAKCIVMICLLDDSPASFADYQMDVLATLIDLISLLDRNFADAVTPMHLLTLGYAKFASTVIELDVVPKLIKCIAKGDDETGIATLNFVRDLSANNESARRQCIDSGILPIVCGKLNAQDESIQLAACQCLHKLSRSIRALKMHVSTTSEVLDVLMEVAQRNVQSDLSVHITAILANFCSEPNSLREALVQKGVLEMFLGVFRSPNLPLRLKCTALLGISALAYVSTGEIKKKISSYITLADIQDLLQQDSAHGYPDNEILENTLILIRNMSHNFGPASSPLREHWDLEWILGKCLEIARERVADPSIVVQCLYIAVNAASGRKQEKDAVIESGWHEEIPHLLRSQCDEIREATMWLLQNLIAAPHFLPILEELSVDRVLESLDTHPNMYIRDRANIVLEEMKKAGGDFSFGGRAAGAGGRRGAGGAAAPGGAGGAGGAAAPGERAAARGRYRPEDWREDDVLNDELW